MTVTVLYSKKEQKLERKEEKIRGKNKWNEMKLLILMTIIK